VVHMNTTKNSDVEPTYKNNEEGSDTARAKRKNSVSQLPVNHNTFNKGATQVNCPIYNYASGNTFNSGSVHIAR